MNEAATKARNEAGRYFKSGYNCTEAIVRTGGEVLGIKLDEQALRMATGFGGGIGHAGCVCGALAGAVMVIGLVRGRLETSENLEAVYELTNEFHRRFQAKFGATCCRVLNPHEFGTKEHLLNCVTITGNTMELLTEFLQEKELAH